MVSPANVKHGKGWFLGVGRDGDRTLVQQMMGLEPLLEEVVGKSVIDVGCAEGLISIELAKIGAKSCLGFEVVPGHVVIARDLAAGLPCKFVVADLNTANLQGLPHVDIVLMLAVLHKLKDPSRVCAAFASRAESLCVVRLPPSGPTITDHRSEFVPHDIVAVMATCGFGLTDVVEGPFAEWTGYFRRITRDRKTHKDAEDKYANTRDFPTEPKVPEPETKEPIAETVASNPAPVVSNMVTIRHDDETPQSQTSEPDAAPAPPPPADEIKVDPADEPAKVEGGQKLFPTLGRRGRRNEAKVQSDDPKTDETK